MMAKWKYKKRWWNKKTKLKEDAQEIEKNQNGSENERKIAEIPSNEERVLENKEYMGNEILRKEEYRKLEKEHKEGNLEIEKLLGNLDAYNRSIERLKKLMENVLKNKNNKDITILLGNINLKVIKEKENSQKDREKIKEWRFKLNINNEKYLALIEEGKKMIKEEHFALMEEKKEKYLAWKEGKEKYLAEEKERNKMEQEKYLALMEEIKEKYVVAKEELIELKIQENMQFEDCDIELVEEGSLEFLEIEPRKEVKIVQLIINTAQVNKWQFDLEKVEVLEKVKEHRNIEVINKITQVITQEEGHSCGKGNNVEYSEERQGTIKEKGKLPKKLAKTWKKMTKILKDFHRKRTRKKKGISDKENVEISKKHTKSTIDYCKPLQIYKMERQKKDNWIYIDRERMIALQIMMYIICIYKRLEEIRKFELFLMNFTRKKWETEGMVV